jgi:hypothetical protein
MNDFLVWIPLFASIAAIVSVAKFWMDLGATKLQATNADLKSERIATELSDFRTSVAEKYASTAALAASEQRLAVSLDGLRGDFGRLTQRIDALIGAMQNQNHQNHN